MGDAVAANQRRSRRSPTCFAPNTCSFAGGSLWTNNWPFLPPHLSYYLLLARPFFICTKFSIATDKGLRNHPSLQFRHPVLPFLITSIVTCLKKKMTRRRGRETDNGLLRRRPDTQSSYGEQRVRHILVLYLIKCTALCRRGPAVVLFFSFARRQ